MAFDAFMEIEGIPGECQDDAHPEWIELRSFSHTVSQPVAGASATGGRTGGRADFGDFQVLKAMDISTPDLHMYCSNGKHIPTIIVEFCLATEDKHTFMKHEFTDCLISSVSASGTTQGVDVRPVETVTFAYGKVKWEYTQIDTTGAVGDSVDRTWNLATNKKE